MCRYVSSRWFVKIRFYYVVISLYSEIRPKTSCLVKGETLPIKERLGVLSELNLNLCELHGNLRRRVVLLCVLDDYSIKERTEDPIVA